MEDIAKVEMDEIVVLNKYEGNLTEEETASAQPLETIHILNGEIVEHIVWEEVK